MASRLSLLAAVFLTIVAAFFAALTTWHLYNDHLLIDAVRNQSIQQQQQQLEQLRRLQQQTAPPVPPVTP